MKCTECKRKQKFKNKYILGEGYPIINSGDERFIGLGVTDVNGSEEVQLKYFPELRLERLPKYRLILERIK